MNIRIEFLIAGITIVSAAIGWGVTKVVNTIKVILGM
jgi:hypothetical protein